MKQNFYDVIILGGGPAGLTAALYLSRARYRVLVMEKEEFGGQITITSEVVNYPGIKIGSGKEITDIIRKQAQDFGAEFIIAEAQSVELSKDEKVIHTSRGDFSSFGVIAATGAKPRSIGFEGEAEFKGRGVAYCATCDGEFFSGLEVFVIGGGFAAAEESVFLTKYARHVTVIVREDDFTCAKATADAAKSHKDITVHYNTEVVSVSGENQLTKLIYRNNKTGEISQYTPPYGETFGVFVFAGYEPESRLFKDILNLDNNGYISTDENGKTNIDGVYAAGDIRKKVLRQMITAASDGAVAATELERYISAMHDKTGIIPDLKNPPSAPATENNHISNDSDFLTPEMANQLLPIFDRMSNSVTLYAALDNRPISNELKDLLKQLESLTDKIHIEYSDSTNGESPCVEIHNDSTGNTGIAFHGVPGGHEFNSFIIGIYNAAGPGQSLDEGSLNKIKQIDKQIDIKILVSLSCTMCPELVMAAQKLAAVNPLITAHAYDINHFPKLRDDYNVMSVPCLVVNDNEVTFGKKNITQLLDYLSDTGVIQ